ncbi:Caspase-6 [Apodemus speciosus]|uniref:Caspase-6 n=1 Tax=Apodemus speciosus TaxID=105296 RepID=A0ABQ0EM50_APOSI
MTETDGFYKSREVFDPAEQYKMDHKRRGIALIFNHERFFWHLTLPERRGTSADRDNLTRRFSELGFEVKCFNDLRAEELLLKIHEVSTSSHVDADCFLCVFLSHGEGNHIYAYDAKIEIQTLTGLFKGDKCQSLVGKPKIFIIQWRAGFIKCLKGSIIEKSAILACRGSQHDVPVVPLDVVDNRIDKPENVTQVDAASVYTLPAWGRLPHVLLCVAEGLLLSPRNCERLLVYPGFVRDAGKVWQLPGVHGTAHAGEQEGLAARVDFCRDPGAIGKKQVPCFASMLTKKLHFGPKPSK